MSDKERNEENYSTSIASEIERKRLEAGLGREEFVRKLGYMDISEGLHRYGQFLDGRIDQPYILNEIPNVLSISMERIKELYEISRKELEELAQQEEQKWRDEFVPHGIIDTERSVPSPIFIVAVIGADRLKKVDLDLSKDPTTYPSQVMEEISKRVNDDGRIICFGKPIGFTINYSLNKAIKYDLAGNPIKEYDRPIRLGRATLSVGGRKIPPFLSLE